MRISSAESARRRMLEAAQTLGDFRRVSGLSNGPQEPASDAPPVAPETGLRGVLDAVHARLLETSARLEEALRRSAALEAENRSLRDAAARLAEGSGRAAEEARAAARDEWSAERVELQARLASQSERLTLLQAERVRLDSLRRKVEQSAAASESDRRAVEQVLREELRTARAALQEIEHERAAELSRGRGALDSMKLELLRAETSAAALRQELAAALADAERRERVLQEKTAALERELAAAQDASAGTPSPGFEVAAEAPAFVQPSLEPVLDPGWCRLLRLVRPPVEAAYAHLRRLSAAPLSAGHRALVRLSAASIAQAADALSSVELVLEEAPSPEPPSSALPTLESVLAAWESALRRQGVTLVRETVLPLPAAAHEPKALRVVLYHLLRNALEALPRGGKLTVRASPSPDGSLRVEFRDDGPGYPAQWLESRFQPFAAARRGRAGLGLALVRKTMRRWGGDAEASNGAGGRGASLVLSFAPPPPPEPGEAPG